MLLTWMFENIGIAPFFVKFSFVTFLLFYQNPPTQGKQTPLLLNFKRPPLVRTIDCFPHLLSHRLSLFVFFTLQYLFFLLNFFPLRLLVITFVSTYPYLIFAHAFLLLFHIILLIPRLLLLHILIIPLLIILLLLLLIILILLLFIILYLLIFSLISSFSNPFTIIQHPSYSLLHLFFLNSFSCLTSPDSTSLSFIISS